ncbi:hypothetical protein N3K66_003675 [Trichothecium roseum]|uniref:Uncharacterized protein n=1 Tax=Trichothecium roseum TaxID=47278 RepID=A0ACC0V6M4_9HYPO|nr:hypothetical protein N3K66_003675 [Trichothecium roseum]
MPSIALTAIITPKPGKAERFLELWEKCVKYVDDNEPGVLRYELHRGTKEMNGGKERYIALEEYADKETFDLHMRAAPVVALITAIKEEELTETDLIMTQKGPGIKQKL